MFYANRDPDKAAQWTPSLLQTKKGKSQLIILVIK